MDSGRGAVRAAVAVLLTAVLAAVGWVVAAVGRGQYLEDLCVTREPAGAWAPPELTVIRGPVSVGPVSFRCEVAADPRYSFGFTDPLPLLGAGVVFAVVLTVGALVWRWALDRQGAVIPP